MPPKVRICREDIVSTAVNIVRENGAEAINARTIAAVLHCSTQPIFSNFATMDDLRLAVVKEADVLYRQYMQREMESGQYPAYKASGMAYIRFAKEEKELFKLLYMRDRSQEIISKEMVLDGQIEAILQKNTGLDADDMKMFHLEMWAYVHGIATMFATGFLDINWELVSKMLTDCYLGLRKQYGME